MKKLLATVVLFCLTSIANATVIYLDSTDSSNTQTLNLDPGTYEVSLIANQDGFDTWNAWGSERTCDNQGICAKGWITSFMVSSNGLFEMRGGSSAVRYATDALALANFQAFTFDLTSVAAVDFQITDINFGDNIGGLTLSVNKVNAPSMFALMGLFLVALGRFRKN